MSGARRVVLVADFNVANLAGHLTNAEGVPAIETGVAPMGQVVPVLVDPRHEALAGGCDAVVVWTRPEGVIETFGTLRAGGRATTPELLREVDRFADQILDLGARVPTVLVPTWVLRTGERGLGLLDLRPGGLRHALLAMNQRLVARLETSPSAFALDATRWVEAVGPAAHDPRAWYAGRIPFGSGVFAAAAAEIRAALAARAGLTRKVIVLDLDDTLWGGEVGEVGWEALTLGGHDPIGEALADFQAALRALKTRGVLLAIASKNDEAVALEAMRRHPEMLLRPDDFVAWRIDWNDKAANVAALARELNLGLDAVVFIDDSAAERARVRAALPEVLVPEWPAQKMSYAAALRQLRCFDPGSVGEEDRARTELYAAERRRTAARDTVGSLDEWLRSLDLHVRVEPLGPANVKRVAQLLNKTNQMNLRTRRLAEAELTRWAAGAGRRLWGFRVRDRFGDTGLVGIASVECGGEEAHVVDFVLSCRVFGRGIERVMVATAAAHATAAGARTLVAAYRPTPRNRPTLEFWERSGFTRGADGTFRWSLAEPYAAPDFAVVEPAGTDG